MKGKFITFEGCEGSGKSSHSRLLVNYLRRKGYSVLHLREPGSTSLGERVRKILLDPKNKISDLGEMLLYMFCRNQLVKEKIAPALKKGKIVICDRFVDATICYQGYGGGLDIKSIKEIGRLATDNIKIDLTIFLDVNVKEGLRRSKRLDRIEKKSLAYHKRVRKGYLKLAESNPFRIKTITSQGTIAQTQNLIREVIKKCLGKR